MDAQIFRTSFVHPSLLEEFVVIEKVPIEPMLDDPQLQQYEEKYTYPIVDNFFMLANNEASSFVSNLPVEIKAFFDVNVYTAKRSMIYIYNYILQNKVEFTDLNVKGLNIADGDIFDNIESLRKAEEEDIKAMREEVQEYMKSSYLRSTSNGSSQSGGVRVRFGIKKDRYSGRYR